MVLSLHPHLRGMPYMVDVAQLVRASDCGSEGRGFEPHYPPHQQENPCQSTRVFLLLGRPLGGWSPTGHGVVPRWVTLEV